LAREKHKQSASALVSIRLSKPAELSFVFHIYRVEKTCRYSPNSNIRLADIVELLSKNDVEFAPLFIKVVDNIEKEGKALIALIQFTE